MEIVAGMILMCTMVTNFDHGAYKMFIKDVETKVHHIAPKGNTLIQYNLKKHKAVKYTTDEELFDIVDIEDMKMTGNMKCRELTNEEKGNKLQKTR